MNHKTTFSDIIGYEKEKEELLEVKEYILDTNKYENYGARIPKGLLLVGASGVGKTLIAKALANEINVPFLSYGDEKKENGEILDLNELFDKARELAPCIIFIDELDKITNNISNYDPFCETEVENNQVRSLLTQMDGFKDNCGIMVIATANSTFGINKSLLRSGRFDRTIIMRMPSKEERRLLFIYYSKNKQIDSNVDFDKLAFRTSGLSCADIDNVLNDAVLISLREGRKSVSIDNIETAIDRLCLNSSISVKLPQDMINKIAVHEVGHAICAILCGEGNTISKVSIESRGNTIGFNRFYEDDECFYYNNYSEEEIFKKIVICYGGAAAEQLIFKKISTGCSHDINIARQYGKTIITNFEMICSNECLGLSMHSIKVSEHRLIEIENRINKILKTAFKQSKRIIRKNKNLFMKLNTKLLETNVLYKEDIIDVLNSSSKYKNITLQFNN